MQSPMEKWGKWGKLVKHMETRSNTEKNGQTPQGGAATGHLFVFEFVMLKVSLSVRGRTPKGRRSIYVQYGCTQKLRTPEVQGVYNHNMFRPFIQQCSRFATPTGHYLLVAHGGAYAVHGVWCVNKHHMIARLQSGISLIHHAAVASRVSCMVHRVHCTSGDHWYPPTRARGVNPNHKSGSIPVITGS